MPHRILIADDQSDVLEALRLLLKVEGYQIETVKSPAAAIKAIESSDFALLLMDLNYARDTTSGEEGLSLLDKIQTLDATLPVVVMTAWATIDLAVEAMRRGAKDFIPKPWDNQRLLTIVKTQIELGSALRAYRRLEEENQLLRGKEGPVLIAQAPSMRPVLEVIARVGPADANVLITGENGSGKGIVAQALHAVSNRASRPLISVNMGGLPEGVFESELFGHVRGAFTDAKTDRAGRFELADQGTLFLDEIGNIPLSQQAKMLRTLSAASSSASARRRHITSTSDSSPRPTPTSPPKSPPAASDRICSSGLTRSTFTCRPCASAAKTSRCSPNTSSSSTSPAIAKPSPASKKPRSTPCSATRGPAMSESSTMPSNAVCSWPPPK